MSSQDTLECIDQKLAKVVRLLEPVFAPQSQSVGTSLVTQLRNDDPDDPAVLDFEADLGRPAASFTVTNLGNTASLTFVKNRLQAESAQRVGPLLILPNTTRTFIRQTESIEVAATLDGPVWVQVDAL